MFRVKDPQPSLDFYTRVLGMTLIERLDFKDLEFTLYFLAFVDAAKVRRDGRSGKGLLPGTSAFSTHLAGVCV
eukprot:366032-Chlamydomonas_euryale.AAC.1